MVFTFRISWVCKCTLTLVSSCNVYPLNKSLLPCLKAFMSIDDAKVQIVCEHTKYFVKKIMHISVFLTYINQKVAFFDKIKTKRQTSSRQQFSASLPFPAFRHTVFLKKTGISSHFDGNSIYLVAFWFFLAINTWRIYNRPLFRSQICDSRRIFVSRWLLGIYKILTKCPWFHEVKAMLSGGNIYAFTLQ